MLPLCIAYKDDELLQKKTKYAEARCRKFNETEPVAEIYERAAIFVTSHCLYFGASESRDDTGDGKERHLNKLAGICLSVNENVGMLCRRGKQHPVSTLYLS